MIDDDTRDIIQAELDRLWVAARMRERLRPDESTQQRAQAQVDETSASLARIIEAVGDHVLSALDAASKAEW